MIATISIERVGLTSTKSFTEVLTAIRNAVGRPNIAELWRAIHQTQSVAEMEAVVRDRIGDSGLMLFMEFDHGAIVRKGTERETPRIVRLLIGNPLIMKEMAKHVSDAGSYAPITVLIDERSDFVHISYDRMASLLAPYGNQDALEVAKDLDAEVEDLLHRAAG